MSALSKQHEYINQLRIKIETEKLSSKGKKIRQPKHHFIEVVDKYLDNLRLHVKRSEATVASITSSLSCFASYMVYQQHVNVKKFMLSECTESNIRKWLEYEVDVNNNSISTRNVKLSHIRDFMRFACDEFFTLKYGEILSGIYKIPLLKVEYKEKKCLTTEQFIAIEKIARGMNKGLRNSAMLLLLYETSIRVGELISLKVKSIDLNEANPALYIEGKFNENKVVPLSSVTADIMRQYMNTMHLNSDKEDPLFYSFLKLKKQPLCTRTIRTIIEECGKTARMYDPSIPEIVDCNMLKRCRATSKYQKNALEL